MAEAVRLAVMSRTEISVDGSSSVEIAFIFMKLFATPLSHFSRKARILLDLYSVPYEFVDIGKVTDDRMETFANNPMMKVPVLTDGQDWIVESDHIADYVVRKFDHEDRFQVQTKDIFDLNARAIMNGIMTEEVKVILARRTSVPTEGVAFFDKALKAITEGMKWLESNHERFDVTNPKYRDIHLVCLWDHLDYYGNIIPLKYDGLRKVVSEISRSPEISRSSPHVLKPK